MTPSIHRRHLLLGRLATADAGTAGAAGSSPAPADTTAAADPLALKLMVLGRRKPLTTLAEHRRHIRDVHGDMVLRYVAAEPHNAPRRYAQHTVFDGIYRASAPGSDDPFALNRDFVTQIWFPDFAALGRSRETAFYRDHLLCDEDNFVDQATVVFVPVRERQLPAAGALPAAPAGSGGGVKLFVCLQRAAGSSADAFHAAWSKAAAEPPAGARPRRHVRNDVLSPPGPPAAKAPPLDGIDEFWFDDEAAARLALQHWQHAVEPALVAAGAVAEGSAFALFAHEAVLHAGPR